MSTSQDMLSIYVPIMKSDIEEGFIKDTFNKLNLGNVKRVDFLDIENKNDNCQFKKAFIHFNSWELSNPATLNFMSKVKDETLQAKIVYDEPNYWICLPNKNPKSDKEFELEEKVNTQLLMIQDLQWRMKELENKLSKNNSENDSTLRQRNISERSNSV